MPQRPALTLSLLLCLLASCIHPYSPEVHQGNIVTPDMVEKLKPGMTKSQVRFVLGSPLVVDPFHPNRWDYVYLYRKEAEAPAEQRHLVVTFNGDVVTRIDGDITATDKPVVPQAKPLPPIPNPPPSTTPPPTL